MTPSGSSQSGDRHAILPSGIRHRCCGRPGTSLALAAPASADPAFHTQRIPLSAVAGAPLQSGAVIDIHTQGPTIYAQERYVPVGAPADTTYQVTLLVYSDPGCTAPLH